MDRKTRTSRHKTLKRIVNAWSFTFSAESRIKLEARLKREGANTDVVSSTMEELELITNTYFKALYILGDELLREAPSLDKDTFTHPATYWATEATMTKIAIGHRHQEASDVLEGTCNQISQAWKDGCGHELEWSSDIISSDTEAASEHPMGIIITQIDESSGL
jgi:hypothetical protein